MSHINIDSISSISEKIRDLESSIEALENCPVRDLLVEHFTLRKQKNRMYSLRAYARDLAMDAGDLSKFLRGLKEVPPRTVPKIVERLGLHSCVARQLFVITTIRNK